MISFYTRGYSPFVAPATLADYCRASERLFCALHFTLHERLEDLLEILHRCRRPCCTTRLLSPLRTMLICQLN
jgi:hypothetical protein